MESLNNLESFVRSAELGNFSAAARSLALTPAAVSRNVAQLEHKLGVRLFLRSTRSLTLTEAGERFLASVSGSLEGIQQAIADITTRAGQPAGVLRVSMPPGFGMDYVLPLLPAFMARYPDVMPDWSFDNRQVDLIGENFDAAIGGGIELASGIVARELARAHAVPVASPAFLAGRKLPKRPADLATLDGIVMRSVQSGRIRSWMLRNAKGEQAIVEQKVRVILDDPVALCSAALQGCGVAMVGTMHVAQHLESGALQRLLPGWYAEIGPLRIYFASQKLLSAKTRVFVDYLVEAFRENGLAKQLSAA